MTRDLYAPSDLDLKRAVETGAGDQTLLAVAGRLFPSLSIEELCQGRCRFPEAPLPVAPCIYLLQRLRPLARVGQYLLLPCPGGVHCHGRGRNRCAQLRVGRCPWPREVIGPVWARVALRVDEVPSRSRLALEVVVPTRGDVVSVGRVLADRRPIGTVQIRGEGRGLELVFCSLPGREHDEPTWTEVIALERALADRLMSQVPRSARGALRPQAPPRPTIRGCGHA